jgi:arylsulfatase A-like enzyme
MDKLAHRYLSPLLVFVALGSLSCRQAPPSPQAPLRLIDLLGSAEIVWPTSVPEKPELQLAGFRAGEAKRCVRRVLMRGEGAKKRSRLATEGQEDRLALISPNSASYSFQMVVPERPMFQFGLGYAASAATAGPLRFIVTVKAEGGSRVLLDEEVAVSPSGTWQDREIDLDPWSGQQVVLTLETVRSERDGHLWAAWSAPEIITRVNSDARWNVVLISLDTLRADRLGSYGYDRPTSPNLDALSGRGVRFETAVSQAPWTRPSHKSLFSGLYPASSKGIKRRPLAWQLWKAGYRTWAVTGGGQVHPVFGFAVGFDQYRVGNWIRDVPELLDQFAINGSRRQFLFLHTYGIHAPYRHDEFAKGLPAGRIEGAYSFDDYKRFKRQGSPTTAEEQEYVRALYDSGIAFVDRQLGQFVEGLEAHGLLKNTVIIVTSDHGEQHWENSAFGHGQNMYDHQLLVPLIVYLPPDLARSAGIRSRGGLVISDQVQLVDVYPTVMDLLSIPYSNVVNGRSLMPLLRGERLPKVDAFAENTNVRQERKALRSARYKFVRVYSSRTSEMGIELYDLQADPGEHNNIAGQRPELVVVLMGRMEAIIEGAALEDRDANMPEEMDPKLREQLKALGYLN